MPRVFCSFRAGRWCWRPAGRHGATQTPRALSAGVLSCPAAAAASSGVSIRRAVWVTVSAACRTMLRSPPAQPAT